MPYGGIADGYEGKGDLMRVKWIVLSAACWIVAVASKADDLAIQSFSEGGKLTFNTVSSAEVYRVEWRTNLLSGQWSAGAPGLDTVGPSGSGMVSCTVDVSAASCFYRVVASTTNVTTPGGDYLVVDLSAGPSASRTSRAKLTLRAAAASWVFVASRTACGSIWPNRMP